MDQRTRTSGAAAPEHLRTTLAPIIKSRKIYIVQQDEGTVKLDQALIDQQK
jgi:hypothetical protein